MANRGAIPYTVFILNGSTWVTIRCTGKCNREIKIAVIGEELEAYETGNLLIQDAMPSLKSDYREMFMTGICPQCFEKMMPPEGEDEEEPPTVVITLASGEGSGFVLSTSNDNPFPDVMSSSNC